MATQKHNRNRREGSVRRTLALCFAFACASISLQTFAGISLGAIADTYTQSDTPNGNFGSSGIIAVAGNRISLVRFDAAAIARTTESTATLQVKVLLAKNFKDAVSVHLITGPWNEKTVTANTLPPISSAPLDQKTITAADQGQFVKFDVSAALDSWRTHPAGNFGIAIVPATPIPNLQLGSREGGSAAVLAFGVNAINNGVTVAATGGDYRDIFTAAENATHGDTWCVHPSPSKPCTIHIARGIYAVTQTIVLAPGIGLVGEDESETILTSSVIPMIRAVGAARITDLTAFGRQTVIYSEQSTTGLPLSGLSLERVRLQAEDVDDDARTVLLRNIGGATTIIDSDIVAKRRLHTPVVGRQGPIVSAVEISFQFSGATLKVQRCRLEADNPVTTDLDMGLSVIAEATMESLEVDDTSSTAREAISISSAGGVRELARQPIKITGGVMTGAIDGYVSGTDIQITGAQVFGRIAFSSSAETILDEVSVMVPEEVVANTSALAIHPIAGEQPPNLLVMRSQLIGGSRALDAFLPLFIVSSILTQSNDPTCRIYDAKGVATGC